MSRIIDRAPSTSVASTTTLTATEAIQVGDLVAMADDGTVYWIDDPNNFAATYNSVTRPLLRSASSTQTVAIPGATITAAGQSTSLFGGGLNNYYPVMTLANGNILVAAANGGTLIATVYNNLGAVVSTRTIATTLASSPRYYWQCLKLSNGNYLFLWSDNGTSDVQGVVYDSTVQTVQVSQASCGTTGNNWTGACALSGGGFALSYYTSSVPHVIIRTNTLTLTTADFALPTLQSGYTVNSQSPNPTIAACGTGFCISFVENNGGNNGYWAAAFFYSATGTLNTKYEGSTSGGQNVGSTGGSCASYVFTYSTGVMWIFGNGSSCTFAYYGGTGTVVASSGLSGTAPYAIGSTLITSDGAFWLANSDKTIVRLSYPGSGTSLSMLQSTTAASATNAYTSISLAPYLLDGVSVCVTYQGSSSQVFGGVLFYTSGTLVVSGSGFSTSLFTGVGSSLNYSAAVANINNSPWPGTFIVSSAQTTGNVYLAVTYQRLPQSTAIGVATTSTSASGQSVTVQYSGICNTRITWKEPVRVDYRTQGIVGNNFNLLGNRATMSGLT